MDFVDEFFGGMGDTSGGTALGPSPAYDPAVGLAAQAPFSGTDAPGLPAMMGTQARTGATNGTPDQDVFLTILKLLAQGQPGARGSSALRGYMMQPSPSRFTSPPAQNAPLANTPAPSSQPGMAGQAANSAIMSGIMKMFA